MSASRPDSRRRVAARNEDEEARPPRYRRLPSSDKLPEPLTERTQNEKAMPIKPAAIRLNPGRSSEPSEPVWRPYNTN